MNKFLAHLSALAIIACCIAQAQGEKTVLEACNNILDKCRQTMGGFSSDLPECGQSAMKECGMMQEGDMTCDDMKVMMQNIGLYHWKGIQTQDTEYMDCQKECTECSLKNKDKYLAALSEVLEKIEDGEKQECVGAINRAFECFKNQIGFK